MVPDYIIDEILEEREHQDTKWGGAEHDDTHTWFDWSDYIMHQITKTVHADPSRHQSDREACVKIAALAIAAIASLDRKNGK